MLNDARMLKMLLLGLRTRRVILNTKSTRSLVMRTKRKMLRVLTKVMSKVQTMAKTFKKRRAFGSSSIDPLCFSFSLFGVSMPRGERLSRRELI